MPYQFVTEKEDYARYASGQVFYSAPNQPAFPVRLSSEIFQRCQAALGENGRFPPYTLYDPCVGSAYHLATLAYLHWAAITQIVGSDIDDTALQFAQKNLNLLQPTGMEQRIQQIENHLAQYGKVSHAETLNHARALQAQLHAHLKIDAIQTQLFQDDALAPTQNLTAYLGDQAVDMVFSDVPYGQKTAWHGEADVLENPVWYLLDGLLPKLANHTIVALALDKSQRCQHDAYQRLDRFQIGKRRIFLLQKHG